MRIATYHRVSTVDQNASNGRDELRAAADRLGGELVLEVEEQGSGARNDRPGLRHVMEAARRRKIDVVIVWALDRFGRSTLDLLANIEQLQAAGVRFIAATQGLDIRPTADPTSTLLLTLLSAVAQFERDIIAERTRAGLARARKDGRRLGRPRTRPPSVEVAVLRERGLSWSEVAAELGCSVSGARRALAENGAADDRPGHARSGG